MNSVLVPIAVEGRMPVLVAAAGERASMRFLEFFAANIRNPHTRRAYCRAAEEFLGWCLSIDFTNGEHRAHRILPTPKCLLLIVTPAKAGAHGGHRSRPSPGRRGAEGFSRIVCAH